MKIFKALFGKAEAEPENPAKDSEGVGILQVQTDRPIEKIADDVFDRSPFAKQIAQIIDRRSDPSSVVIGMYGPWGDGKTSTLAMVKEHLGSNDNVLTLDYNPWFFGENTEAITRSFFNSIRDKLEKSGWFSRETIGSIMSTYGKVIPNVGESVHALGAAITTEALTETRDKVGALLAKHGKKMVIFIDDIDRLDRAEIQTLFKLVRLSGGFDHTTYILAFDDRVVAEALGEAYGSGNAVAGQRFLEKIVQVPLHLPAAQPDILRTLAFAACDRVFAEGGIELPQEDGPQIGNLLAAIFAHALKTPRQIKLFDNAITFAVPLLVGEVRVADQIVIEALRVFYPQLYDAVRKNPDLVLKSSREDRERDKSASAIDRVIDRDQYSAAEREMLRETLHELFPRFSNTGYGDDWDKSWSKDKRICSSDYFNRYFAYTVPTGDISDSSIEAVIQQAIAGDEAGVIEAWTRAIERKAVSQFVRKLRDRETSVDLAAIPVLARSIAKTAHSHPATNDLFFGNLSIVQAAVLMSQMVSRLEQNPQDALLREIAESATSLTLIVELLRFATLRTEKGEERGFLAADRIEPIVDVLIDRLSTILDESGLPGLNNRDAGRLFFAVLRHGRQEARDAFQARLSQLLSSDPQNAIYFLRSVTGRMQGGDGVIRVSDFTNDSYKAVTQLFDPSVMYSQLRSIYGSELDTAEWTDEWRSSVDEDRRLAEQFSSIHRESVTPSIATDASS